MDWMELLNLVRRYVTAYETSVALHARQVAVTEKQVAMNEARASQLKEVELREAAAAEKLASSAMMNGNVAVRHTMTAGSQADAGK